MWVRVVELKLLEVEVGNLMKDRDVYIYFFVGVVLKDGLLVGVILVIVLVFLFGKKCVWVDIVMIGEMIFRGFVFLVGGVKDKVWYCFFCF